MSLVPELDRLLSDSTQPTDWEYIIGALFALDRPDGLRLIALLVVVAVLIFYVAASSVSFPADYRVFITAILWAIAILLGITVCAARSIGMKDARESFVSAEHVHLVFKGDNRQIASQYELTLLTANDQGNLH